MKIPYASALPPIEDDSTDAMASLLAEAFGGIEHTDQAEANFLDVSTRLAKIEEMFSMFDSDEEFEKYETPVPTITEPPKTEDLFKDDLMIPEKEVIPDTEELADLEILDRPGPVTPREWPPRAKNAQPYQPKDISKLRRKSVEAKHRHQVKVEKLADKNRSSVQTVPLVPSLNLDSSKSQSQSLSTSQVNTDDLPPGFPPAPRKQDKFEGGNKEAYKEFMKQRLQYEQWENGLVLYRLRLKEGNTEVCKQVMERLKEQLRPVQEAVTSVQRPTSALVQPAETRSPHVHITNNTKRSSMPSVPVAFYPGKICNSST